MHANKGITFDLDAIRRLHPRHKLLRFSATTGNTTLQPAGAYDTWVFVDGQPQFRREHISAPIAFRIAVELNDQNRFLTLVATDGGDEYWWDCVIFGDPRLEVAVIEDRAEGTKEKHLLESGRGETPEKSGRKERTP